MFFYVLMGLLAFLCFVGFVADWRDYRRTGVWPSHKTVYRSDSGGEEMP